LAGVGLGIAPLVDSPSIAAAEIRRSRAVVSRL
jgi:hypothetical protein